MAEGQRQWPGEVTVFLRSVREEQGVAAEVRVRRDLRKLAEQRHRLRDITSPLDHGLFELIT